MRLKLDENLGLRQRDLLRSAGHDVDTVRDERSGTIGSVNTNGRLAPSLDWLRPTWGQREASVPVARSVSESEEDDQSAVQPYEIFLRQSSQPLPQVRSWHRRDFVNHDAAGLIESRRR